MSRIEDAGMKIFGSGWVWLSADADGTLFITQSSNAHNPLKDGLTPILTIDVWEHAYYLDYQNRRSEYLSKIWDIIDWEIIESRYE
jgi:Fe-Mn family superoxide dismutase